MGRTDLFQIKRRGASFSAPPSLSFLHKDSTLPLPAGRAVLGSSLRLARRSSNSNASRMADLSTGGGDVWRAIFSASCFDESLRILGTRLTTATSSTKYDRRVHEDDDDIDDENEATTTFHILGFTRERFEFGRLVAIELCRFLSHRYHRRVLGQEGGGMESDAAADTIVIRELQDALQQVVPWWQSCGGALWSQPAQVNHALRTLQSLWTLRCAYVDWSRLELYTTSHCHNLNPQDIISAVRMVIFCGNPGVLLSSAPRTYVPDGVLISFCAKFDKSLVLGNDWTGAAAADAAASSLGGGTTCAKKFRLGSMEFIAIGNSREQILEQVVERNRCEIGLPPFLTMLRLAEPLGATAGPPRHVSDDKKKPCSGFASSTTAPLSLHPTGLQLNPTYFSIEGVLRTTSTTQDAKILQAEISSLFSSYASHIFFIGEGYQIAQELAAYARASGLAGDSSNNSSSNGGEPVSSHVINHIEAKKRKYKYSRAEKGTSGDLSKDEMGGGVSTGCDIDLVWLTRHPLGVSRLFVVVVVFVPPWQSNEEEGGSHAVLGVLEMSSD